MKTLETIDLNTLAAVTGGARGWNTGITGGLKVPNNDVPRPPLTRPCNPMPNWRIR